MVQDTIEKIEGKIRTNDSLSDKNKTELLELLASLKTEMGEITSLKTAANSLQESVKEFEVSHPQLVEDVNYFSTALANMGL